MSHFLLIEKITLLRLLDKDEMPELDEEEGVQAVPNKGALLE